MTRFYQPVSKKEEDSDSDSESGTSSGIVKEDIAIKEKKNLKWVSKPILLNCISFRTKVFYVTFKVFSLNTTGLSKKLKEIENLKATIHKSIITWSAMGKQTTQPKEICSFRGSRNRESAEFGKELDWLR